MKKRWCQCPGACVAANTTASLSTFHHVWHRGRHTSCKVCSLQTLGFSQTSNFTRTPNFNPGYRVEGLRSQALASIYPKAPPFVEPISSPLRQSSGQEKTCRDLRYSEPCEYPPPTSICRLPLIVLLDRRQECLHVRAPCPELHLQGLRRSRRCHRKRRCNGGRKGVDFGART